MGKTFQYLSNLPGWHTNRKIVVIHSDDWGSIRMPSLHVRNRLLKYKDIDVSSPYNYLDTLASTEDLEALFDVLTSVKDKNGHYPVITANCVVTNPDFDAIKKSQYNDYFYDTIPKTFEKHNLIKSFDLWKEGIITGIFIPQFHGREHVNVAQWLEKLKANHPGVRKAFEHGVYGADFYNLGIGKSNFQAAWDFETEEQKNNISRMLIEGIKLFEQIFDMPSVTAIAPSYTWANMHEKLLFEKGIKQMQGIFFQKMPLGGFKYKRKMRFTKSEKEFAGYQMRNVFFEPALIKPQNQIDMVLKRTEIAFKMRKPAVIGSHRLNYIGVHDETNRKETLDQLRAILNTIIKKWPDAEFMSAVSLAKIMIT
ncbi:MAG: hypothetical protein B6D61_05415 [Bacteroidetes bacterium 4484_249]|nr:MAG: hypothetical protein B6D61_05415 [Bacteroidetes bacterium 4484_249]